MYRLQSMSFYLLKYVQKKKNILKEVKFDKSKQYPPSEPADVLLFHYLFRQ